MPMYLYPRDARVKFGHHRYLSEALNTVSPYWCSVKALQCTWTGPISHKMLELGVST